MSGQVLSRRGFVAVSGGAGAGLVLGFSLLGCDRRAEALGALGPGTLNAWIRVGTDDTVSFLLSESEMGQGTHTALAMLLAEELEVPWDRIRTEHSPADQDLYGRQSTGGSTSMRSNFERMRVAGASARLMLIEAAALRWAVPASECRVADGRVEHDDSGRSLSFGELADAAAGLEAPESPPLKEPAEWRLIGKRIRRLDSPSKIDGSAIFGMDVKVPGMLTALVARPPVFGGSVRRFDPEPALAVPGVRQVVEIPSGVVVAADGFWAAKKGRDALEVEWNPGDFGDASDESIRERCRSMADDGAVVRSDGATTSALEEAATRIEAEYEAPFLAHATMEPVNCVADVRADGCDIWTGTQAQTSAQDIGARITGLPTEKVRIHTQMLGGGFGRRSRNDFVADAVEASKALGAPVKLMYTREDDMRAGSYRPVAYNRLVGGVDGRGMPTAWEHRMVSPSILLNIGARLQDGVDPTATENAGNLGYSIPNIHVTWTDPGLPVSVHFWRAVSNSQNVWVTECFLDELAAAGDRDPVDFRLALLGDHPRRARALRLAAEKAGWTSGAVRRTQSGADGSGATRSAMGCAVAECFGSVVAQVAEVEIRDGLVRVPRVVCAVDCGFAVNPDTIEAQMESGIVYGLSAALYGKISIENGAAAEGNFDRYPIMRLREMPRVETHIIAEGDALGGIGEVGLPCIAPAVCNALFALTGEPVRSLPIGDRYRS
ncbi:MAG: xanthine dehydrogenase family protein molybdopterin-binding subunit [marine benthic group bacterium]|nr:xanthine dehydrogenase family protein molybdopterin-binding subunit [Gemmatimonadota bacterium]